MAKETSNFTEKEKDKMISSEIKRLTVLYKDLGEDKLKLYRDLISNCAFLAVSLEDIKMFINKNGFVENYQNGATQWGRKKSPEAETYTTMVKQYAAIVKQLDDALPHTEKPTDDGFDRFVGNRDD